MDRARRLILAGLLILGMSGRACGAEDRPRSAGASLAVGAVLGVAAVALYGKADSYQRDADRFAARAAFELEEKPSPFYVENYYKNVSGASRDGRRARRLNSLALGTGTVAAAFLLRGFLTLDYDGDVVEVRKEWRF